MGGISSKISPRIDYITHLDYTYSNENISGHQGRNWQDYCMNTRKLVPSFRKEVLVMFGFSLYYSKENSGAN